MLKPKQNKRLVSDNFLLASHISVAGLNMVIEVFLGYVNICAAVGGESVAPEAQSFHSVWPFLPYFEADVEKRKKIPVRHQSSFWYLSPH